jgi:hypothetical protein
VEPEWTPEVAGKSPTTTQATTTQASH